MEQGLKYIAFYVQKHIVPWEVLLWFLLVRDKPLGAVRIGETGLLDQQE